MQDMSSLTTNRKPLSSLSINCAPKEDVGARKRYRKSVRGSEKTRSPAEHASNQPPYRPLQPCINHIGQPQLPWEDVKATELGVFELFWDDEVLGVLVERTNMYAEEKGVGKKVLGGVAFGRP